MPNKYIKKRQHPKNEKTFLTNFMEELKAKSPRKIWYFKSHGEPMQVRGIPDVLICYFGLFLSIEFKIKRHGKIAITPYQEYTIDCITQSNGISLVIWHDEDTAQVGIGTKIFEDIHEAIKWLIDVLESALKISCCNLRIGGS